MPNTSTNHFFVIRACFRAALFSLLNGGSSWTTVYYSLFAHAIATGYTKTVCFDNYNYSTCLMCALIFFSITFNASQTEPVVETFYLILFLLLPAESGAIN